MANETLQGLHAFLAGPARRRFSNAVMYAQQDAEREALSEAVERLAKWAGTTLWKRGYRLENFEMDMAVHGYGRKIQLFVEVQVEKAPPTIRQFCWQFVQLAEAAEMLNERKELENQELRERLAVYENVWYRRLWRLIREHGKQDEFEYE